MGVLDEKVAIVTDATSGIGARIAETFAAQGARVVLAGRRREAGRLMAETVGGSFVATDVTVERQVETLDIPGALLVSTGLAALLACVAAMARLLSEGIRL